MLDRLAGMVTLAPWLWNRPAPPAERGVDADLPPGAPAWRLPLPQMQCAEMLLEITRERGQSVQLVDVNRPSGNQGLVDQWVGPDDLLPLLVRPDGARLSGIEAFVPGTLKRFVEGAPTALP